MEISEREEQRFSIVSKKINERDGGKRRIARVRDRERDRERERAEDTIIVDIFVKKLYVDCKIISNIRLNLFQVETGKQETVFNKYQKFNSNIRIN